ncbi:peptidylprolyl isomerase [Streptosporangium lutulentum]
MNENLEGAKYTRGVVAMANSGADTNGSQFFIVFGDTQLPPNYTPFGTVTKGLEIIDKVNKARHHSGARRHRSPEGNRSNRRRDNVRQELT